MARELKFQVGDWVEVTVRREGGFDAVHRGKVVEASRDRAVAEVWTEAGPMRFSWGEETEGYVLFRRLRASDFRRRR